MPKEQVHFGEHVPGGPSKSSKDRINSATMRAALAGARRDQDGTGGRVSCDSEKDSGYSESGSDLVQNDLEPYHVRNNSRSLGKMSPYTDLSPICVVNNLVVKPSGLEQLLHPPLTWGETWHSLSGSKAPTQLLFIQQPRTASLATSNLPRPPGQTQKGGSGSYKNPIGKNSYLPILNSYPRIAPHPGKEGPEQGQWGTRGRGPKEMGREGQGLSKRACTEDQREVSSTAHLRPRHHHHHQREGGTQPGYKDSSGQSSSPRLPRHPMGGPASSARLRSHHCRRHAKPSPSGSDSAGSPSTIGSSFSSFSSCADSWAPEASAVPPVSPSVRQRRFLNTAEILSQSGLLAIALRTKELLRQNAASERELAQLRQHAQLLRLAAQATHTGQDARCQGPGQSPLDELLRAMSQSGCYPSLDWTHFKADGLDRPEKGGWADKEKDTISVTNGDDSPSPNTMASPLAYCDHRASPPSPLFALSPDPEERPDILASLLSSSLLSASPPHHRGFREQGCGPGGNPCDLAITPDSSTPPGLFADIF